MQHRRPYFQSEGNAPAFKITSTEPGFASVWAGMSHKNGAGQDVTKPKDDDLQDVTDCKLLHRKINIPRTC